MQIMQKYIDWRNIQHKEHQNRREKSTGRLTSTLKEKAQTHKENLKSTIIRPLQKTEAHSGLGQGENHQIGVQQTQTLDQRGHRDQEVS